MPLESPWELSASGEPRALQKPIMRGFLHTPVHLYVYALTARYDFTLCCFTQLSIFTIHAGPAPAWCNSY